MLRTWLLWFCLAYVSVARAGEVCCNSLHDAHIHYDKDVWHMLSPTEAVQLLQEADIERALVSATPAEGAERLYREAPDLVVPMLRPYKSFRHRYLWFRDPELKTYLLEHLDRVPYRGFGEFHVFGEDANSEPIAEMIALARERKLVLHPHTDLAGMRILLQKTRGVNVLWAHGGFDVPVATLRDLLAQYPQLTIELSLREGMLDDEDRLIPQWRSLLTAFPQRFVVGMDTYKPSRWAELSELTTHTRLWLQQLPDEVATALARENFARLFPRSSGAD